MSKQVQRVRLDKQMIDNIWYFWDVCFSGESACKSSKTVAIDRIANIVGCSHSTVYRVVSACEEANSGRVISYDRLKYPNAMMVKYINKKFATGVKESSDMDSKESTSTESNNSAESSDIKLLANSIDRLAAAIEKQNEYAAVFTKSVKWI